LEILEHMVVDLLQLLADIGLLAEAVVAQLNITQLMELVARAAAVLDLLVVL
jgi:hypothetical protein